MKIKRTTRDGSSNVSVNAVHTKNKGVVGIEREYVS